MRDKQTTFRLAVICAFLAVSLFVPAWAQDPGAQQNTQSQATSSQPAQSDQSMSQSNTQSSQSMSGNQMGGAMSFNSGEKYKVEGLIVDRGPDTLTVATKEGQTATVVMNDQTQFKERKSNPFRSAKKYAATNILPGLRIQADGTGNGNQLVAREIRFTQDDYQTARAIESRVTPVQKELAETRQNAERLSGQVSELSAVSNAARGGAVAAQQTADSALNAAGRAQGSADEALTGVRTTNERIGSLDNYDIKHSTVVNFRVNSARLSPESKAKLDEVAQQISNENGFIIEVTGFASSDGSMNYNRDLSQRRADAVVRYLAEQHNVPLRRIIQPFGYGELQPVADNSTRDGREQNRRVEVRVLINRGINNMAGGTTNEPTNLQPGQNQGGFQNQNPNQPTTSGSTSERSGEVE